MRHAESLSREGKNYTDGYNVGLSSFGRVQARLRGHSLLRENITRIVSSSMARAQETAEIIGGIIDIPVSFDKQLEEYAPSRTLHGKDFKEANRRARADWSFVPENGESVNDSAKRFLNALKNIAQGGNKGNIVVVSHALIIQNALMVLLRQKDTPEIDEVSLTTISYDGTNFHVDDINKRLPYFWRLVGKVRKRFEKDEKVWE